MLYARANSAKEATKELEHRLTALEHKIEPLWDAIRKEIGEILIKPHTPELDSLIKKAMTNLKKMTNREVKNLSELLDREYYVAIDEGDKGRAIGISLFKATLVEVHVQ